MFLMMALSVIGASLMLLSQTETYSSLNYRLMSQARYGAESGIQKTVNYLLNPATTPRRSRAGPIRPRQLQHDLFAGACAPASAAPRRQSSCPPTRRVTSNYPVACRPDRV